MKNNRVRLVGFVTGNKMQKTIVVEVSRVKAHPLYHKVIRISKSYLVHDEAEVAEVGNMVQIVESRPISKRKHWALEKILQNKNALAEIVSSEAE